MSSNKRNVFLASRFEEDNALYSCYEKIKFIL